ncbi:sigma-70 family RNA polymerase sigma factor [Nakamurella sp. YIM 132087]|uniref:Sigma-70 family RNA polymerase sigma factor n=1 Tax=Nakamurella alba TaxID=2665158 RepID=A0A7K1FH36_9ACTN|nr:sigma-70 family RNA polymerase sigma factor [Nakamurella alba]MTD12603.1 sigma-70 family RNA polymerase sigma factor [Nakamurella alba]
MDSPVGWARRFEAARPRLRAAAASLLGSTADADDVVQDAWLRLERADPSTIGNLDAWLTTVVSRLCLDQLRSPRRTRQMSWQVAPWPDDPGPDDLLGTAPDPADLVAGADRVGVALLMVLETLGPTERLAFVLHDVFGLPFEEIATSIGRTPAAARQLASRGRRRLREASAPVVPDHRRARRLVDAWLRAVQSGDLGALLALLAENAVLHADLGTQQQTLEGVQDIAAQALLSARLAAHSTPILIGGRPGVAASFGGRVVSIMAFGFDGDRIVRLDVLADPGQLADLDVDNLLG